MEYDVEQVFCRNLKAWIEKNYYRREKELASILGISVQQLNNIKHGRRVGNESWRRWLADQLGLDYNALIGIVGPSAGGSRGTTINVVAGPGEVEIDDREGTYRTIPLHEAADLVSGLSGLTLNTTKKPHAAVVVAQSELQARSEHDLRAFRIREDTMWPRVPEGSLVFADLDDKKFIDGKIYIVREPYSQPPRATLRTVRRVEQRHFTGFALISENQRYLPEMTELEWNDLVVGRAIWIWRNLEGPQMEMQLQQTRRMESIDWLAGGVAHDLNNILSPIIGYGEMVLGSAGDNVELKEQINHIIGAGKRAQALTRQLLAFSRHKIQEFVPVDVNEQLRNIEHLLLRAILKDDITLHMSLASPLPKINGDAEQIEQVIVNLVNNAQDAMPEGGDLRIQTGTSEISDEQAAHQPGVEAGHYISIMISDTGRGMDEYTLDRIFEPFFTTKKKDESAGLGLSTAYGIIKQHGGNIWADSKPGLGTTIKIYLPIAPETPAVAAEDPEIAEVESTVFLLGEKETTILVVEDDRTVRHMCASILRKQGYQVIEASDGKEAISITKQAVGPVHLMLTDVNLPDIKGENLYHQLTGIRPNLPVLYMSAYARNVIDHHGILGPEANFIQKPFSIKELIAEIERVLSHAKSIT